MSLASLSRRLTRLEQTIGTRGGPCACPRNYELRDYTDPDCTDDPDTDTRPARLCERCGRPMRIVQLVNAPEWPP